MLTLFWFVFWAGLTVLTFAAGITLRARLREEVAPRIPVVDDETIQRIVERGELVTDEDEPLDLGEIDEEEKRFWSESWDEPDEW